MIMNECMDEWIIESMEWRDDGGIDERMDGWIDEWMEY